MLKKTRAPPRREVENELFLREKGYNIIKHRQHECTRVYMFMLMNGKSEEHTPNKYKQNQNFFRYRTEMN